MFNGLALHLGERGRDILVLPQACPEKSTAVLWQLLSS